MKPGRQILIVDDDADIREIEAEILTGAGYSVMTAENGKVALTILATCEEPCLVLLNVVMPEMTGTEVLDVLRRNGRLGTLPVVVVSPTYAHPGGSNGERGFLRKPVTAAALLTLAAEYCPPCEESADEDAGGIGVVTSSTSNAKEAKHARRGQDH